MFSFLGGFTLLCSKRKLNDEEAVNLNWEKGQPQIHFTPRT